MSDATERIKFSYCFCDKESGIMHEVNSERVHDLITADELCEMFIDFMNAAGYSEEQIFKYFKDEDEQAPW